MWTEARYDLRLTDEEFYALTPRQLVWLRERHRQEREYQELLIAINTSTLANHSFNPPKKAYKPYDFMPTKAREAAEVSKEVEPKQRWTNKARKSLADQLVTMRKMLPSRFIVMPAKTDKVVSKD